jgi:hypothetical protein
MKNGKRASVMVTAYSTLLLSVAFAVFPRKLRKMRTAPNDLSD